MAENISVPLKSKTFYESCCANPAFMIQDYGRSREGDVRISYGMPLSAFMGVKAGCKAFLQWIYYRCFLKQPH